MLVIDYSQAVVAFGVFCAGCALGMFGGAAAKPPSRGQGLKFHALKGFSVGRSSKPIFDSILAIALNSVLGLGLFFAAVLLISVLKLTGVDVLSSADRRLPIIFMMIAGMGIGKFVQDQRRRRS